MNGIMTTFILTNIRASLIDAGAKNVIMKIGENGTREKKVSFIAYREQ